MLQAGVGLPGRRALHTTASRACASSESIRSAFLQFFEKNGHTRVAGSALVPYNDPSLLFTNAGMVQFKDAFTGRKGLDYSRATSSQGCIRAGGKHNDLDNVGFTPRHHTYFEMLGNFSFGDYFKEEAISYAWDFVTKEIELPADNLRVSVHHTDEESATLWKAVAGLSDDRILRLGDEDNFWSMGDGPGPCGPCTEIFWDQGEGYDDGTEESRWLEVWNLVFMQYQRDDSGELSKLPSPCVDTGMGLERVASVLQGCPSNFETDELMAVIHAVRHLVSQETGRAVQYTPDHPCAETSALRVIADHLRAACWLIAEGVAPSNVGRGYVLRRIIRRAIRYGHKLGVKEPFFHLLVPVFASSATWGDEGPTLVAQRQATVTAVIQNEEEAFLTTLHRGIRLLETELSGRSEGDSLPAAVAFKLYDTYGFPLDLTQIVAKEHGMDVDVVGAEQLLNKQRDLARRAWSGSGGVPPPAEVMDWANQGLRPEFVGYNTLESVSAVKAVAEAAHSDTEAWVCLDPCPFYAEGGGQAADVGTVSVHAHVGGNLVETELAVVDTVRPYAGGIACRVVASENELGGASLTDVLSGAGEVVSRVDAQSRVRITAHHTDQVMQAGSSVTSDSFRFDFTHNAPLTPDQVAEVERWVNAVATENDSVKVEEVALEDAKERGAIMLFGERYGDSVRMVSVGDASVELCGGCHVKHAHEVFPFKLVSEGSIAAGVRRIEAAVEFYMDRYKVLEEIGEVVDAPADSAKVLARVKRLSTQAKELRKEVAMLQEQVAKGGATSAADTPSGLLTGKLDGVRLFVHEVAAGDDMSNKMMGKLGRDRATALAESDEDSVHLVVCGPSITCTSRNASVHSGQLLREVVAAVGGRGGGQAGFAQGSLASAGGTSAAELIAELASASIVAAEK